MMLSTQVLPDRTRHLKRDCDEMSSGGSDKTVLRKGSVDYQLHKIDRIDDLPTLECANDCKTDQTDRLPIKSEVTTIEKHIVPESDQTGVQDGLDILIRRRLIKSVQRQPRYRFQIAAANLEAEDLHQENHAWYLDEIDEIETEISLLEEKIRKIKRRKMDVNARYMQQQDIIHHENEAVQVAIDKDDAGARQSFVQDAFRPHVALAPDDTKNEVEKVYELGGLSAMGVIEDYRDPEHSHFIPQRRKSAASLQPTFSIAFPRHHALAVEANAASSLYVGDSKMVIASALVFRETLPLRPAVGKTADMSQNHTRDE